MTFSTAVHSCCFKKIQHFPWEWKDSELLDLAVFLFFIVKWAEQIMILAVDNFDHIMIDILNITRCKNLCPTLKTIQPLILKDGLIVKLLNMFVKVASLQISFLMFDVLSENKIQNIP